MITMFDDYTSIDNCLSFKGALPPTAFPESKFCLRIQFFCVEYLNVTLSLEVLLVLNFFLVLDETL